MPEVYLALSVPQPPVQLRQDKNLQPYRDSGALNPHYCFPKVCWKGWEQLQIVQEQFPKLHKYRNGCLHKEPKGPVSLTT